MLDSNNFLEIIKRAAVEANEQGQPCELMFGMVVSASPLRIRVEQKLELGEAQLILTRNVTDHKIKIKGRNIQSWYYTQDAVPSDDPNDREDLKLSDDSKNLIPPHVHAVGEILIEVKNALKTGEQVILIRQRGGQKYLVLDRRGDV